MANNVVRTCPKCGTPLGQKNLCPVCDRQNGSRQEEQRISPDVSPEGVTTRPADYFSLVIQFVENHQTDWDDEFIDFFNGLAEKRDFNQCYEACSKVSDIFKMEMPDSGKISGSLTKTVMTSLQGVFPELTTDSAFSLALDLLKRRVAPAPPAGESGEDATIVPGKTRQERYRQMKYELLETDVRDDFKKVMKKMKALLKEYPDIFMEDYFNFFNEIILGYFNLLQLAPQLAKYSEMKNWNTPFLVDEAEMLSLFSGGGEHDQGLGIHCPYAFFAAMMLPQWNDFIYEKSKSLCLHSDALDPYYFTFFKEDSKSSYSLRLNGDKHHGRNDRIYLQHDFFEYVIDRNNRFHGEWKELVPKGKTVLLLETSENIELRSASESASDEIINAPRLRKAILLDGLQYRCRYYSHFYDQAQFAYIVSPE